LVAILAAYNEMFHVTFSALTLNFKCWKLSTPRHKMGKLLNVLIKRTH